MIKLDAGGKPIFNQKLIDPQGRVLTVTGWCDKPTVFLTREDGTKLTIGQHSHLAQELEPYEERKRPRCEPKIKENGQHWLGLTCPDEQVPSLGRVQVWDFIDGNWHDCHGEIFTPEEQCEERWMYIGPALINFDLAKPLRTIRYAIGDVSTEETFYAKQWSDEDLSAAWRQVCSNPNLTPAQTALVFARRILAGEQVP